MLIHFLSKANCTIILPVLAWFSLQLLCYIIFQKIKQVVMANLDVQPKKRSSILPWLLLGLGLIALIFFLTRNKDNRDDRANTVAGADSTSYTSTSTNAAAANDWNDVNWNAPRASYDEVSNRDIDVRSGDNYAIYGLGENVLFDTDKATLKKGAEDNLKQIAASINKRYNGGEVRVFGYTDAQGNTASNKELSQQRADAVRNWLSQNGVDANRISVHARGEDNPAASNNSEEGRQQNRRVEIVARRAQ